MSVSGTLKKMPPANEAVKKSVRPGISGRRSPRRCCTSRARSRACQDRRLGSDPRALKRTRGRRSRCWLHRCSGPCRASRSAHASAHHRFDPRDSVRVHWSFLIALPLIAFALGSSVVGGEGTPDAALGGGGWLFGLALTFLLFGSVLIHELAHALYARRDLASIPREERPRTGMMAVVHRVAPARPGDEVWTALRAMNENEVTLLPVVDEDGSLVGALDQAAILRDVELRNLTDERTRRAA